MERPRRVGVQQALRDRNARPMDFTGRPMKAFVFVSSEGLRPKKGYASTWGRASLS
jgi:hypothetical protein